MTGPDSHESQRIFRFEFENRYRRPAALFGIEEGNAVVTLAAGRLVARFGRWVVSTPLANVSEVSLTGPYRFLKTAGPAHLSLSDRGITFASNSRQGVYIAFAEPVTGIEPLGVIKHPNLTVRSPIAPDCWLRSTIPRSRWTRPESLHMTRPRVIVVPMVSIGKSVVAVLGSLALLSGCASGVPGTAAIAGWTSSPAAAVLGLVLAGPNTKWEIYLVNPPALNALDAFGTRPLTTTGNGSRPAPSDAAFVRYSMTTFPCYSPAGYPRREEGAEALPNGAPRVLVSIAFAPEPGAENLLSVCVGPRRSVGPNPSTRSRSAVASVTGYPNDAGWVGFRAGDEHRFAIGKAVPAASAEAVVAGSRVAGSLLDDPQVKAVLQHSVGSATLLMGTELLTLSGRARAASRVSDAVSAAQSSTGRVLPDAEFSAYAWGPGRTLAGTARFITTYASNAEAQSAAPVIKAAVAALTTTHFAGSTTEATEKVVVTTVPNTRPDAFDLRNLRLLEYPGYLTR